MVRDAFNASFELRTAPVFRGWSVGEWIIEDASGVETCRALVASPKCMPRRRRLRKYNNRAFPEEELEPLLGSQNSEEFMVPCRRRRRRLLLRTTVRVTTYSRRRFPIHMHVALRPRGRANGHLHSQKDPRDLRRRSRHRTKSTGREVKDGQSVRFTTDSI